MKGKVIFLYIVTYRLDILKEKEKYLIVHLVPTLKTVPKTVFLNRFNNLKEQNSQVLFVLAVPNRLNKHLLNKGGRGESLTEKNSSQQIQQFEREFLKD
jgi:hypothetical protein